LIGQMKDKIDIVKTIICGDTYFNEKTAAATEFVVNVLKEVKPDLVVAGPAFNAGRYGMACGGVAKIAAELGIQTITGMYPENPGYDMYKAFGYFVETSDNAAGMRQALPNIAKLITSFIEKNGKLGSPKDEGYMPRNVRVNYFAADRGAKRAVDMLIKKLHGEKFETEYPMPVFDRVDPAPAIADMSKIKLAFVTSGGIVPKGNPDHIESSSASKYGKYSLANVQELTAASHQTAHGGYDPTYANANPNRVLPVDMLRQMEKEGKIGSLHEYFYTTVGNGTAVANCRKFAQTIAKELIADGVMAVILTST
jgi:glycine reductase